MHCMHDMHRMLCTHPEPGANLAANSTTAYYCIYWVQYSLIVHIDYTQKWCKSGCKFSWLQCIYILHILSTLFSGRAYWVHPENYRVCCTLCSWWPLERNTWQCSLNCILTDQDTWGTVQNKILKTVFHFPVHRSGVVLVTCWYMISHHDAKTPAWQKWNLALCNQIRQFCTTGPSISLGGIWVGWSFRLNMGGINPTVCHPNPRPTTLRFFWHSNSSVPKTKI